MAHIGLTAAEIEAVCGVSFEEIDGDLMAVVQCLDDLVWLVEFPGGRRGTTILGSLHPHDATPLLNSLLEFLGLEATVVEWRRWDDSR